MSEDRGRQAGQSGCVAQTKQGAPCRTFALRGRDYCIAHDPERAGDARNARAKGGAAASKLRALKARRPRLDTST